MCQGFVVEDIVADILQQQQWCYRCKTHTRNAYRHTLRREMTCSQLLLTAQLNHSVTYGTSAAPFLATRCLKKLADDSQANCPRAAQVLSKDFYVDELLSGTTTTKEGHLCQRHQRSITWILRQQWASIWSMLVLRINRSNNTGNIHIVVEWPRVDYEGSICLACSRLRDSHS